MDQFLLQSTTEVLCLRLSLETAPAMSFSNYKFRWLKRLLVAALAACMLTFCGQSLVKPSGFFRDVNGDTQPYVRTVIGLLRESQLSMEQELKKVTKDVSPLETKELRKRIGEVRDILDLFAHHFLTDRAGYNLLRNSLDRGYTVVGNFKDLHDGATASESEEDLKFDKALTEKRRKKVLKWKDEYLEPEGISERLGKLLTSAAPLLEFANQDKSDLSRFFWGGVDITPDPALEPAQNARRLALAQAEKVFGEAHKITKIDAVSKSKNETQFHDFRKRLRAVTKICNLAIKIKENSCTQSAVDSLLNLVDRLGNIEDLFTGAVILKEEGRSKAADRQLKAAQKSFEELKFEWAKRDLLEPLKRL